MIGAIIGDMAAWTYEHDRDTFWRQLIPDDCENVELSVYGHAFFRAASRNVLVVPRQDVSVIRSSTNLCWQEQKVRVNGQWLMWQLMCAWNDNLESPSGFVGYSYFDKEEDYASMFVVGLVRCLRKGMTKSEAYHSVNGFENLIKSWRWRPWQKDTMKYDDIYSLLTCVFRAWDSFYRGFDFASSVRDAMKWEENRHLTAILTASFASAMYGCSYSFIKKKYAKDGETMHTLDLSRIGERFGYSDALCRKLIGGYDTFRSFYPKNMALTNVERHQWLDIGNLYDYIPFSDGQRQAILRCAPTSWDNRYGLYLDDGCLYVYRSRCLIGRFWLKKYGTEWFIANTQLSGECSWKEFYVALSCALTESCHLSNFKEIYDVECRVSMCKYYQGQATCPEEWKNTKKGNFWYGEMMFCAEHIDMDEWRQYAEDTIKGLTDKDKLTFAKSLSARQFGMLLYIETLFRKWHPYDDTNWIFEY